MKIKKYLSECSKGIAQVIFQILIGFAGQIGALIAFDYYHRLKDEYKTKRPIGFQTKK